jgi:uncharacterized membrane protein
MHPRTAITVGRPREEVERLWAELAAERRYLSSSNATVTFVDAPADYGTEIHVQLAAGRGGDRRPAALQKLIGAMPLAKAKDDLRRFKQLVETGEIARSDAAPQGERVEGKFRPQAAEPLPESELEEVGRR